VRAAGLAALALAAFLLAPPAPPEPWRSSPAARLLGPVARIAAAAQWVRVDRAIRAGREELALSRARAALALDPASPAGWSSLVHHLAFELGARALEPDPLARRRWFELALATAEEGEARSSAPEELAFQRALLWVWIASLEPDDRPLPAPEREAWERAAEAFERAARLGHPLGAEAALGALAHARAAGERDR
jgi:hypothetical protein